MSMNFTTVGKSYGDPKISGMSGLGTETQQSSSQNASKNLLIPNERREGNESGYQNAIQSNKSDSGLQAFPHFNLKINRVDSKEYKQRQERSKQYGGVNQILTHSLIAKPYTRDRGGDSKLTSTSVDKNAGNYYLKPAENSNPFPSNQSDTNKPGYSNRYNYATYRKEGPNMSPRYGNERESDNGSNQNQAPSYNRRLQQLDIGVNMVSSVISRESDGKGGDQRNKYISKPLSTSSRGKLEPESQAYQLYNSRHPNESIRRSTIEISKAISSNAITELERQNENQNKKIKKLQNQLQDFKNNLKKWDDTKHRFQLDIQSKSRQVFDLERDKKRLHEQLQSLRAYRTMQTVEQVIIVRLKQQIMQLNKKIIDMQAQHYKNQKMLLQKLQKDGNNKPNPTEVDTQKQKIQRLQLNREKDKKQIQLLGVELQKQKQKSWMLQRQKQQYLAQKVMQRQDYDKDVSNAKRDVTNLRQEIQRHLETIRAKDVNIEEIKHSYSTQIQKLTEKNKSNEAQINKIKVELTQQVQLKEKEAAQKKIEEQKRSTQKKMQEQLTKKLQQQKRNFDAQLSRQLKDKQLIFARQIDEQKRNLQINFANQIRQKQSSFARQLDEQKRIYEGSSTKQIKDKEATFTKQLDDQKKSIQSNFANQMRDKQTQFARQLDDQKRNLQANFINQIRQKQSSFARQLEDQKRVFQTQLAKQIKDKQIVFAKQNQQQKKNLQLKQLKERQIAFSKQIQDQKKNFEVKIAKDLREKEIIFNKQLEDQKKAFDLQLNTKLSQKQQQYKAKLNQQMRLYEAKIIDQGKNEKLKQSQQKQVIDNLRQEKQKSESQLKQRIIQFEQNIRVVTQRLNRKQQEFKKLETRDRGTQEVTVKYEGQIKTLKNKIDQTQNSMRQAKAQNQMTKKIVKQRQAQIQNLKRQNIKLTETSKKEVQEKQKWKQQQISKVQQMIRVKIQTQFKQKERDFDIKKTALQQDLVQTKAKLQREQQQMIKLKQVQEKVKANEGSTKQLQSKYNGVVAELNALKNQTTKWEQKCKQAQIDLGRATENVNIWKIKVENLEKSRVDWQSIQQQRDQLKVKIRQAEEIKNNRVQLMNKYEQLLAEHQVIKQKLKLKQQENAGKQTTYYKIKQHYESSQSRVSALNKQIINLTNKVEDTSSKFRSLLSKVEMEEYRYKQLYDKMVSQSQVFVAFMKKLQQENQAIFQKYLKVRKLCRANHIKVDDTETSQKADYSTFRQYLQKQVASQFTKMIMPKFEALVFQKISQVESRLTDKYKKLIQLKNLAQVYKRKKLAAKK